MTTADSIRIITAVLLIAGALLTGAVSHQRAHENTRAQGLSRAGLTLEQAVWAAALIGGVLDWSVEIRLTTLAFAAVATLAGLVWDSADIIRGRPDHGPFARISRYLARRGK